MKYQRLLRVKIQHDYFADGQCRGVSLQPGAIAKTWFRRHRCLWVPRLDGGEIVAPVESGGRLMSPWSESRDALFHLRLDDDDVAQVSRLEGSEWTSPSRDRHSLADLTVPLPALDVVPEVCLLQTASLRSLALRWAYYCVVDIGAERTLSLRSASSREGAPAFDPSRLQDLRQQPDPRDTVGQFLVQRFPGLRPLRFVSSQPIPIRQLGHPDLAVWVDEERWLEGLPNPSIRKRHRLSMDDTSHEDVLYHVLHVHRPVTLQSDFPDSLT